MASDLRLVVTCRVIGNTLKSFFHLFHLNNKLRRIFSAVMVTVLLSNPAAAATVEATPTVTSFAQDVRYAFYSSGWAKWMGMPLTSTLSQSSKGWDGKGAAKRNRPAKAKTETREDREARIARIKIYPGDVEIFVGEQVVFTAIGEDYDGNAIGGVDVEWEWMDEGSGNRHSRLPDGVFSTSRQGTYKVTAEIAGRKEQVRVIVKGEGKIGKPDSNSEIKIDSRELRNKDQRSMFAPASGNRTLLVAGKNKTGKTFHASSKGFVRATSMMSVPNGEDLSGWNSENIDSFSLVGSERGNMPMRPESAGIGSGNLKISAPAVSLGGRGVYVNLSFNYNSRVWHKSGSTMYFDIDRDWLSGWNLGFGKIVMSGSQYLMIDSDGTRHEFSGTTTLSTSTQSFSGRTTDGTFIDYSVYGYRAGYAPTADRNIISASAVLPNGTKIEYGATSNYAIYPTKITDAHGNYITITYRNNAGPNISTITDTLGRVTRFHYDASNLLTAITAPGLQGGAERQVVRLAYSNLTLSDAGANYGFQSGLYTSVRQNTIPVLRGIYYPGTSTGYWFGDPDSYSSYGMIRKISSRVGMTFSGGLNEQGTFGAGTQSSVKYYENLDTPGYSDLIGALDNTPMYTQMREDWVARQSDIPVTTVSFEDVGGVRQFKVTRPDGTYVVQHSDIGNGSPHYGLMTENQIYSSSNVQVHRTQTKYIGGEYGSSRPEYIYLWDEKGQMTYTHFGYESRFNAPTQISNVGYSGQLLKKTTIEYLNNDDYNGVATSYGGRSGRHIFNLPRVIELYSANDTRVSRTEYEYDGKALLDAPNVPRFDKKYNPFAPTDTYCGYRNDPTDPDCKDECNGSSPPPQCDGQCDLIYVCNTSNPYDPQTRFRGDVTKSTTFADAVNLNPNTAIVANYTYDITGNKRIESTACCEQTTFNYTANTAYALPESMTRGSVSDAASQNKTSLVYDFNTGLVLGAYDANGRYSNIIYNANSLRPEYEYSPTGSYIYHIYNDAGFNINDIVYEAGASGNNFVSRIDVQVDGKGRAINQASYNKDYTRDAIEIIYDIVGRAYKQSLPFKENVDAKQWTITEFDFLDRPIKITSPDGSVVEKFYNEGATPIVAVSSVGQTVRSKDAWGRERWGRFDEQNRLVEVVEPDPAGNGEVVNGGMRTWFEYDTLGNLIQVNQGEQVRRFKYDSLGRMTHQKLAERDATLDESGNWTTSGTWSDVFNYDIRSNLIHKKDARGVVTQFEYNDDPLNRLKFIRYRRDQVPSHLVNNIPDAPNVSYIYATSGDRMRLTNVSVDGGLGNQEIYYDIESRVSEVRQSSRGGIELYTNYLWDSLSRIKEIRYPQQLGSGDARKIIVHNYEMESLLKDLTYDNKLMASNPVFNAANQMTALTIGSQLPSGNKITEKYDFDPKTGLLTGQQVNRGSDNLLDLKYNYLRKDNSGNDIGGITGQLTSITDLKKTERNRDYEYDKLGRLVNVKGGATASKGPDWNQIYAYDRYGNKNKSESTETAPITPVETTWFDDSLPQGATAGADGGDSWNWEVWSPSPYSGNVSHQSNNASGIHQHYYFSSPNGGVHVEDGTLYAYIYLDPDHIPEEVMLQWGTPTDGWDHRAYWGANKIGFGTDGTASRKYMGSLPQAGSWVRLAVQASDVGLEGKDVNAIAFTLYGGRANWDLAGIEGIYRWSEEVCNPDYSADCWSEWHWDRRDFILVDDSFPPGSPTGADGGDGWNWTGWKIWPISGDNKHVSNFNPEEHSHWFENASNTMDVKVGDKLFAWVFLDPANMPEEVMLQWKVNDSWEFRAFWGGDIIQLGEPDTHGRYYAGPLPEQVGWVKLEVPASAVNLEGRTVNGMAFNLYGGRATWDKAGKITTLRDPAISMDGFSSLTYNSSNNRITSPGFEYDPAGNQTASIINESNTQHKYKYDSANRLREVLNATGNVIASYTYGSSNERIASTEGGVTTYYTREGGQVLAEYEALESGGLLWKMSYIYMGGRLLATEQSEGIRYHHPNKSGTRLVTDASDGIVISENISMPFGTSDPSSWQSPDRSNLSQKKFASYDRSESTGLDYAVNRHYSSAQGRFTQVDPLGMGAVSLGNPQSLNLYGYTGNDPINGFDPLGLCEQDTDSMQPCDEDPGDGDDDQEKKEEKKPAAIALVEDPPGVIYVDEVLFVESTWEDDGDGIFNPLGTVYGVMDFYGYDQGDQEIVDAGVFYGGSGGSAMDPIAGSAGIAGAAASIGEYSSVKNGQWRGDNGKWYSLTSRFHGKGNLFTGERANAVARAKAFNVLGKSMFAVSAGISIYNARQGNIGVGKASLDVSVGALGVWGGSYGAAGSAVYFVLDTFVGWDNVGKGIEWSGKMQRDSNVNVWNTGGQFQ